MLNLKKVIASICVLAMVLSTVAFGATYTDVAEDSVYYEAVETLTKLDIVEGFDGEYRPEDGVTRAEMAALIARIQGYGETAKGAANTAFTDVPSSHWASGYIANASGMGIINGYGDGTFGPEDPVLYEQAIKMVMATLGYTPYAEKNGGYPTGYLAAAQRQSVSLAVANAAVGQEANRGTVAQILTNALDTPLMIQSSWNTDGIGTSVIDVGYTIADGTGNRDYRTLMSENLGYVKIRGIVKSTGITQFDSAANINTTKEAAVVIDVEDAYKTTDKTFYSDRTNYTLRTEVDDFDVLAGTTDVADYLGQSVIGYVKKLATDKYEMVSVAVDTNRNDVLEINLAEYAGYNSTTGEISYYKDGANKPTEVKLAKKDSSGAPSATYLESAIHAIINGEGDALDDIIKDSTGYIPATISSTTPVELGGMITLIDNDDTKGYDVVMVELAATAVVREVNNRGIELYNVAEIAGKSDTDILRVYPDDESKVFEVYKDGELIDYTELNEWDVLSVYATSKNADVVKAVVIGSELTGTITSTKRDYASSDSDTAYKVGDNWYAVAAGAYNEGMAIGAGGKFYIDEFGKIAAFIEDSALAGQAAGNFGYVLAVTAQKKGFDESKAVVKLQVLTDNGVEVLEIKNGTKLNAIHYMDMETTGESAAHIEAITLNADKWDYDTTDSLKASGADNTIKVQSGTMQDAITAADVYDYLESDVEGKVVKYTADSNGKLGSITVAGYKTGSAVASFTKGASALDVSGQTFDAEISRFTKTGAEFWLASDAKVFVAGDEANSKVVSAADLVDKTPYEVKGAYKTKGSDDYDMVVITATTFVGTSETMNLAVVKSIATGVDEETGADVYIITYLQGEEEFTYATTDDVLVANSQTLAQLSEGDIIQVKLAGDKIASIGFVFDFTNVGVRTNKSDSVAVNYKKAQVTGKEKLYAGYVTEWNKSGRVATLAGISGYNKSDLKLSATNVYTIDNTGANLLIEIGGGFTSLGNVVYDDTVDTALKVMDGATSPAAQVASGKTDAQAAAYGDWVFVREYEDRVVDLVIVKAVDTLYAEK